MKRLPTLFSAALVTTVSIILSAETALKAEPMPAKEGHGHAPTATIDLLGTTQPANAPGQQLYLLRVTIDPGFQLPPHFHAGTQVASIESGELSYIVRAGSVDVHRTLENRSFEVIRTVEAGESDVLVPGEWIVETEDDIHFGANEGDIPVVILLSTLLDEGASLSNPAPQTHSDN